LDVRRGICSGVDSLFKHLFPISKSTVLGVYLPLKLYAEKIVAIASRINRISRYFSMKVKM